MRFCKWIFLLSLFFVLSSCVFNPRGQPFQQAPISILVMDIPADHVYIPYPGLVIVLYMTDYNRLSNIICILNCCLWKHSPVMIFLPLPSASNTHMVSLWTCLQLWFLFWREVIFICDSKCSLERYQHTLRFPFTMSDVGKIRFCCQIVDLMISFLFLIQLSANSVSFSLQQRRLNSVTVCFTHQTVCSVW